ncbi:AMP_1a_G0000080.mRNA.1.CDS.1 [Saccharomyces cerevisiae]|nr:AMP_1a_G0000080.mRNA.1.CDS.1 [Saccharomyces cerevisiae]CAI6466040.1 AMP_1a_G0000080.mRNA.1.CDS.1 [Saccharomyces cerevisiae]
MVRTCNMCRGCPKTKPHHLWQHLRETPSSCQTLHRNRAGPHECEPVIYMCGSIGIVHICKKQLLLPSTVSFRIGETVTAPVL